ncbi:MAG: TIGR04219 family outer membrane beta-barrel protein [Sulfuricurvum sp.]
MMKKALLAMCLGVSVASAATILGLGVEADYYAPTASGDFSYTNNSITTHTHFNEESESTYQVGVYFEHPIPLIPNFRLDLTPEASFSGSDGSLGTNKVSVSQTDITPYYEILDNVVDLDIGVTFKVLDIKVEGTTNQEVTETIPMGYVAAGVDIPGTGLRIAGDVKHIYYKGDSFTDARIKAVIEFPAGLQAQGGYRYESLKISDHYDMNADVKFQGPFIGLGYTF